MAEPHPGPPSAPQCSQFPPPSLGGLIPPSHFVLRPRSLGAELAVEKGRVHELEVELKALRERNQALEAELEVEKGRNQCLEAALEAERGRGQALEAELDRERGQRQRLEAERRRSHVLEVELEGERGRSQILEMELEALRGQGLGPKGAEPSPEQVLLSRWRQKVFQLLLQVRLHRGQELRLQGQALSQERLREEVAEEELRKLGQALRRLLGTLGVALANVTTAVGALETLSERLGRARHRLHVLVASGRFQWQRQPEGTVGDSSTVAPEVTLEQLRGWHQGDNGGGSVPRVPPSWPPESGDGTQPCPDTVSLAPLVTQLQVLGAAILGDIGDLTVPPPLWDSGDVIREQ